MERFFIKRYYELNGYNVLFPFAFHGTGMPIVACAGKLKDALEKVNIETVDINSLDDKNQIKILIKTSLQRGNSLIFDARLPPP